MMPLCLYIYTKMWVDSGTIVIPYDNIGKSFLCKISDYYLPTLCLFPADLRPGSEPAGVYLLHQQLFMPNEYFIWMRVGRI